MTAARAVAVAVGGDRGARAVAADVIAARRRD